MKNPTTAGVDDVDSIDTNNGASEPLRRVSARRRGSFNTGEAHILSPCAWSRVGHVVARQNPTCQQHVNSVRGAMTHSASEKHVNTLTITKPSTAWVGRGHTAA